MSEELDPLRKRLQELVSLKEDKETKEQEELEERMAQLAKRQGAFSILAERLFSGVLEPRLKLLEEYATDSKYHVSSRDHFGGVVFNRQARYSASFKLEMGIDCDPQIEALYVTYRLRIIPILMTFEGEDSLALPLEEVTEEKVATFVDDKLAQCIETYTRFQEAPHYQKAKQVTDPVCGMTIHEMNAAASAEFGNTTYYFCANICKERFLEDPSLYSNSTVP